MDSLDLYCAYRPLNKYVERGPGNTKPFLFGNQQYVISEQIVRHVQESLSLSIGMVTPSGEVVLISPTQHSTLFMVLLNKVLDHQAYQAAMLRTPSTTPTTTPATSTNEPIMTNHYSPSNFQYFNSNQSNMEVTSPTTWNDRAAPNNTQLPSCSKSTSCSELGRNQNVGQSLNLNFNQQPNTATTNATTPDASRAPDINQCPFYNRLSAREQRKLRKYFFDNDFPNENDSSWC